MRSSGMRLQRRMTRGVMHNAYAAPNRKCCCGCAICYYSKLCSNWTRLSCATCARLSPPATSILMSQHDNYSNKLHRA